MAFSSSRIFSSKNGIPALIDVDCNLLHPDLLNISSQLVSGKDATADEQVKPTDILYHSSTKKANIVGVLSPASTIEESIKSLDLPEECNKIQIKITAGIHPYHTEEIEPPNMEEDNEVPSPSLQQLQSLLKENSKRVACVGECGLDYSEGFPEKEFQIPWFQAQIDLAYKFNLPLFLHERLAFEDTLELLDNASTKEEHKSCHPPKIIIHCFTGTNVECKEYIARGYYISLSGFLLKQPMGDEIRQCLVEGVIPLEKLMIETDAPYMGFKSCRDEYLECEAEALEKLNGKKRKRLRTSIYPNVPSSLVRVLEAVTEALNEGRIQREEEVLDKEQVAIMCTKNAIDFFGFK